MNNNLRELIKEDYKNHNIEIDENCLDSVMKNKERVKAFAEILKIDMGVYA